MPKRQAGSSVSPALEAAGGKPAPAAADPDGPQSEDEDGGEQEDLELEAEELKCQVCRPPILPTKAEVDAHNLTHLPFRSWCSACVRGRGRSIAHRRIGTDVKEDEQISTISIDYGFFGTSEGQVPNTLPVLIVRDRRSKSTWSHPVPSKGVEHPWPAKALMNDLDMTGYKRVILKSDQEPSIVALVNAVKHGWHGEIIPEASPKGESKSNGEVERAVQSVHGLARTIKDFIEQQSGVTVEPRSPLLAWLVEHCGNLLLLFHKGEPHDGHTAYMRLKGKPWRVELPGFGECVEYRKRTRHKLENRWKRGIFVGVKVTTTEKIVADREGTYVVQSIRRVPVEHRYDAELLRGIRGTPWEPNPASGTSELPEPLTIVPKMPEIAPAPSRTFDKDGFGSRSLYIRKSDLKDFGFTAGCPACDAQREGAATAGKSHTSLCRKRLEKAMSEDPEACKRVEQTTSKQNEWVARKIARADQHSTGIGTREGGAEASNQEAANSRKRPAEVSLEDRAVSQEAADAMETDREVATGQKRAAEIDTETHHERARDGGLGALACWWADDEDTDQEEELNLLLLRMREDYVMSVHAEAKEQPVCEEPAAPYSYDDCGWDFIDDTSGKYLNTTLVQKARSEEIEVINEMGIWEVIDRPLDVVVYGTRWVDINKGDESQPYYRSRLVVQEFRGKKSQSTTAWQYFTATPPLEALRILLICATIKELPDELGNVTAWAEVVVIMLIDVRRAHFYSKARREIHVELPSEAGVDKSKVGRLIQMMYGCRDAGVCWEFTIAELLINGLGFMQGRSSPCIYFHRVRKLRVWVHGDDFVPMGSISDVRWFESELRKAWTITNRGILGPPGYHDCVQSLRILGRIVEWTAEGITWEADPRHAELIWQAYNVSGRNITTPGVKDKHEDVEEETLLDQHHAEKYRANTMRAQYLSVDRPEIQFKTRELAKRMKEPTNLDEMALKRLARFLCGKPRLIWLFRWQQRITKLATWCDTDHAGCIRTRKSVSGNATTLGTSCVCSNSKGQAVIALSSGEAEYYGLVSAASSALGLQSILADWGWKFGSLIWMDATTGIAIGSRRGLGRVKHIDTVFLWVQAVITDGRIALGKKVTTEMLADFLTKNVDAGTMMMCLRGLDLTFKEGSSKLRLKA